MTTAQYIKKFNLGDINFANKFNTDLFLQDFSEEFQERIDKTIETRKRSSLEFEYRIFQVIIGEMQQKFCAISNKKAGGPLHKELWSAFYAKSVIPAREKYFPEEHAEIQAKREMVRLNKIRDEIREEVIDEMEYEFYEAKAQGGPVWKDMLHTVHQEVERRMANRGLGQ